MLVSAKRPFANQNVLGLPEVLGGLVKPSAQQGPHIPNTLNTTKLHGHWAWVRTSTVVSQWPGLAPEMDRCLYLSASAALATRGKGSGRQGSLLSGTLWC